ncbi:MAG: YraN family protein [Gammaproteobacteria bacterium]
MSGFKPRRRHTLGARAETAAARYLEDKGLELIGHNYNCRFGEIDLIMRDQLHLAFIEVRYRSSNRFGGAIASVERHKQKRLIRTAQHYLAFEAKDANTRCRFDVVAVTTAHFDIQWVQNAFALTD